MARSPSNPRHITASARARRGVSLLEVLLATTILFGSVVILAELAQIGRRHAQSAGERVTAQMLCVHKLNELAIGLAPITSGTGKFEDAPGWTFAIDVEPVEEPEAVTGLVRVRVTVEQDPQAPENERRRSLRQFTLTRWLPASDESLEPGGNREEPREPPSVTDQRPSQALRSLAGSVP